MDKCITPCSSFNFFRHRHHIFLFIISRKALDHKKARHSASSYIEIIRTPDLQELFNLKYSITAFVKYLTKSFEPDIIGYAAHCVRYYVAPCSFMSRFQELFSLFNGMFNVSTQGGKTMRIITIICTCLIAAATLPLFAREFNFQLIELENVSRYSEDRIAFQHIELPQPLFDKIPNTDNSIETLLIIRSKKMYLLKDGYDNLSDINLKRILVSIDDKDPKMIDKELHGITGKPNYVRITERRIELLKKIDINEGEDFVSRTFGKFYTNTRNAFLKKHIEIFRNLIIGRKEAGLFVERVRLPRKLVLGGSEEKFKFATYVTAKSEDEKIYFAADADGDNITETFWVRLGDGFNWGFESGPNIIFIYNNTKDDIKQLIGNLTKEAVFGTSEEENIITKDMESNFKLSGSQGKNWDDTENINLLIEKLIYESELKKK